MVSEYIMDNTIGHDTLLVWDGITTPFMNAFAARFSGNTQHHHESTYVRSIANLQQ